MYCKNNGRFTQLLIILPDDRLRLAYFWKHTRLWFLHVQKYLPLISLSEHMNLFFFFTLFGFHYHVATFGNLNLVVRLVSIWRRKPITQSRHVSLNTHLFAYMMCLSCSPEQKSEQSGLLGSSSSNEGSLLPSESHPSCHTFSHAALLDGDGSFGAPLTAL